MHPNGQNLNFRRLDRGDLPLLLRWHNEPHVKRWYEKEKDLSTITAVAEEYSAIIDRKDPTESYIILAENKPIGYIQAYMIKDDPLYAKALDLGAEEAAGMDIFIGEPEFVYKGWGALIIKKFLKEVVFTKPETESCVIGPEPANKSAIRAYEKAGFRYLKTVNVPGENEPEYIMRIPRAAVAFSSQPSFE